ncbi:hypothetical protein KKF61_04135 [Patescibacteria group bacterium]|nr:hypothetical protein [Patescibacteria group bacterium]MBU0963811.1 hypothetical protein [Patescibacteria group bacterium]
MCPLDGISPPNKNYTPKTELPAEEKKQLKAKGQTKPKIKPKEKLSPIDNQPKKENTMWILVGVSSMVIVIIWILSWQISGPQTQKDDNSLIGRLSQTTANLWESIKADIFNIKNELDSDETDAEASLNNNEEYINELENQFFPQFEDPQKQ